MQLQNSVTQPSIFLLSIFILFQFGLSACVQMKPRNPKSSSPEANTRTIEDSINPWVGEEYFRWELEDSGEPSIYFLRISWKPINNLQIHFFLNGKAISDEPVESPFRISIPSGKRHLVELKGQSNSSSWISLWSRAIDSPNDLIIKDALVLKAPLAFKGGRVFFEKEGSLTTMGHKVVINVNSIYSRGGRIETFFKGTTASMDQNGRAGGVIEITANQAFGDLTVDMRGEHGGSGSQGLPWETAQIDAPPAFDGEVRCDSGNPSDCECRKQPENGKDGLKGNIGRTGNPGGAGGSSGHFNLILNDASEDFNLRVNKDPGSGGMGGAGGPGQLGGKPSPPGKYSGVGNCRTVQPGNFLGPGDVGLKGSDGKMGKIDYNCITRGNRSSCD